jgi:hypothetical protein
MPVPDFAIACRVRSLHSVSMKNLSIIVIVSTAYALSLGCEHKSSSPTAPKIESSAKSAGESAGKAAAEGSKAVSEGAKAASEVTKPQ